MARPVGARLKGDDRPGTSPGDAESPNNELQAHIPVAERYAVLAILLIRFHRYRYLTTLGSLPLDGLYSIQGTIKELKKRVFTVPYTATREGAVYV